MRQIYLLALVATAIASCTKLDDPVENVNVDDIIEIQVFNGSDNVYSLPADSNSSVLLTGILGTRMKPGQSIEFSTTHGLLTLPGQTISEGKKTLTVDAAYREALVVLHSGKTPANDVIVSAKVGEFSNVLNLIFAEAYPELMNVGPAFINAAVTDTSQISLFVSRNSGVVSDGVPFNIESIAPDTIPLNMPTFGVFEGESAQVSISNPLGKVGVANVQITTPIANGDTIIRTIQLIYQ